MKLIVLTALQFILVTASAQNILPTPQQMEVTGGRFKMKNAFTISCQPALEKKARYLAKSLNEIAQLNGTVVSDTNTAAINLILMNAPDLETEGYKLMITVDKIKITANKEAGILYGIQSLLQLVYEYKSFGTVDFPCLKIKDNPKYAWRSFMLDSGRQYQTLQFLKRYLDYMAFLKMNVFHWHLTENDGWRIEIKKYPKLTTIGAQVAKGPEQQGYYSQQDIKEIIEYASELNIIVVPEIDLPGHANAALYAYPEMTCFKKKPQPVKGFSPYIFCGGRESTYQFIEGILYEVCALFPSEYIHLGGDEAPKDHWDTCPDCQAMIKREGLKDSHELQQYFSKRLAGYLKTKGKKAIFWDDVISGNNSIKLPDNTIIMWWNTPHPDKFTALKKALDNGYPVIGATWDYNYLYLPVTPWVGTPIEKWTFDMRQVYNENPSDLKNPDPKFMGMGACMWSDHNSQEYMVDRRVFPRIFALSEQMWHVGNRLPFNAFYKKVKEKYPVLKAMHIDVGPALKEETPKGYRWQ